MENRHSQIRLFCEAPLKDGAEIVLGKDQAHYLATVMRKSIGTKIALFNGKDGCFLAEIRELSRKSATIHCLKQQEAQWYSPDIWLIFAPVKKARLDFMAQKATELGASVIWPVRTEYTQVKLIKDERLQANAIEAAEQTERLDIPEIRPFADLQDVLSDWPDDRVLLFCDERLSEQGDKTDHSHQAHRILNDLKADKIAILVGPEGGFSMVEKDQIDAVPSSVGLSLGPRILRADTAALAALGLVQAIKGDW